MDLHLKDKVFLVAGASKGLGFAIAEQLVAEGAGVSIAASHAERLAQAVQQLRGASAQSMGCLCDVRNPADINRWVDNSLRHFGRIDGIVTNAGGPPPGSFDDFDDEAWMQAFHLTLMSAVRLCRAVLPVLRAQRSGSILMLTSSSVKEPIDILLLSNVMRAGVSGLAKSLSKAEAANGIRVNNLVPGIFATDRMLQLDATKAAGKGVSAAQQRAENAAQIPLNRYGNPAEFARAAVFLLSDAASYITGSTLVVDGGKMSALF